MTTDGVTVKTSGPFHDFGFTCPVAEMGDGKVYRRAQYQYGTTSHPAAQMSPGAIIYPQMGSAPEEDVKRTFAYAKANGKCVSVRTGGHAYNGSSSCSSDNVQLDISEAFLEWGTPYWGKEDADSEQDEPDPEFTTPPVEGSRPKDGQRLMLRVGASFQLLVLNLKLSENDDANGALFMPTGQCYNVHLGGHSNTGGLGQLSRAFGYLIDNVHTAEIITPEGEMLKIGPKKKDPKKREMFYNMFGGGPGNYAVLTHLTIMPYRSKDYPHARCMKHMMPYNHKYDKKVLAALFNVLVAFKDAPQDYDLCLTAGSGEVDYLWNQFGFANRDSFMSAFYPGSPSRKDEDKWWKYNKASPFAGVVVFFQYSNLDGKPDSYDPKWAAMLKEAFEQGEKGSCCWRCCEAIANCCLSHPPPLIPKELRNVDDDDLSYSISDMVTKLWTYGGVREYNFPYIKCDQITEQEFGEGFADWAAEKLNYLFASGDKGLMASMQSQQFGGAASKVVKNGEKMRRLPLPQRHRHWPQRLLRPQQEGREGAGGKVGVGGGEGGQRPGRQGQPGPEALVLLSDGELPHGGGGDVENVLRHRGQLPRCARREETPLRPEQPSRSQPLPAQLHGPRCRRADGRGHPGRPRGSGCAPGRHAAGGDARADRDDGALLRRGVPQGTQEGRA